MRPLLLAVIVAACCTMAFGQPADGPLDLPAATAPASPGARYASLTLVASLIQVQAGEGLVLAGRIDIQPGWVFYSPAPGQAGDFRPMPASFGVPSAWMPEVLWSSHHPHQADLAGKPVVNQVYTGTAYVFAWIAAPAGAAAGPQQIPVVLEGQLCAEHEASCLPVRLQQQVTVQVGAERLPNPAWTDELAAQLAAAKPAQQLEQPPATGGGTTTLPGGTTTLPPGPTTTPAGPTRSDGELTTSPATAPSGALPSWMPRDLPVSHISAVGGIALCLLAGLILNVMPCVLPVVPLRILSVVELARQSHRRYAVLALAFAGGILLFFAGLAAANLALRATTSGTLNWAEHFQNETFRIAMGLVMVALAGNLFGLFEVPLPVRLTANEGVPAAQGGLGSQLMASAGMGLMMAVLATPCSFAILASALAWAQLQTLWLGTVGLLTVGVGMAFPHALLAGFPRLLGALPRPGRWMELLKQSMGFVLLLVALWLFSTLADDAYPFRVMGFAVVLSFGLWMWGSWPRHSSPEWARWSVRGVAVVLAVVAGWSMLPKPAPATVVMEPFDSGRLESALAQGKPVLVKFTASWCLSCRIVEYEVYEDPQVVERLARGDVVVMKGDVTRADMPANALLYEQLGGAPPLTVILRAGAEPIRLEGKFAPQKLLEAMEGTSGK